MAKRYRRKVLLASYAAHDAKPADPAPADALIASNIEVTPVEAETATREIEYPYYGASPDINYNVRSRIAFDVAYAGSGAAGTAPGWAGLARACGMVETITADAPAAEGAWTRQKADAGDYDAGDIVSHDDGKWQSTAGDNAAEPAPGAPGWKPVGAALYTPVTGAEGLATIWLYIDGILHKLAGCRGTFSLSFAQGLPSLRFDMTGRFADPTDMANPAANARQGFADPVVSSFANTPTVLLHGVGRNAGLRAGVDLALQTLTLDYGAEVVARDLPGAQPAIEIVNRTPSGQITVDAPSVAGLALVKRAKEGLHGAFRLVHGTVAGNVLDLAMPKLQLASPSYSESSGYWQVQANHKPLPVAGNDEIAIVAR